MQTILFYEFWIFIEFYKIKIKTKIHSNNILGCGFKTCISKAGNTRNKDANIVYHNHTSFKFCPAREIFNTNLAKKKISKKLNEQGIIKQLAKPQIIKKKMNSNEQILQDEFAKNQNKQTEGIELNSEKYIALEKQQIKSILISKLFKEQIQVDHSTIIRKKQVNESENVDSSKLNQLMRSFSRILNSASSYLLSSSSKLVSNYTIQK